MVAVLVTLLLLFGITMAQNAIRYGIYEGYNPWRSVLYLSISLLLFAAFAPLIYRLNYGLALKQQKRYWLWSILLIPAWILIYFVITGPILIAFGFLKDSGYMQYARQYFGKEALFHLLVLVGTAFYVKKLADTPAQKLISGTVGRKAVTLQAELIYWIEADDHYLKIYSDQDMMMKRSSLEKMSQELQPDFIRIHRKYLVNTRHIVGKERQQRNEYVIIKSGEKLRVGRSYSPLEIP